MENKWFIRKNRAILPNFIKAENIQNLTEEPTPELKIKKIILSFTLYTGTKLFTYELVLRPK